MRTLLWGAHGRSSLTLSSGLPDFVFDIFWSWSAFTQAARNFDPSAGSPCRMPVILIGRIGDVGQFAEDTFAKAAGFVSESLTRTSVRNYRWHASRTRSTAVAH